MSISTSTPTESVPSSGSGDHRWLIVGLVAVLALALGFGAGWALFAPASPIAVTSADEPAVQADVGGETSVPPELAGASATPPEVVSEVEALLGDFFAAWTAGDTDAAMALMMPYGSINIHGCLDAKVDDPDGTGAAACIERYSTGSFSLADTGLLFSGGPPYEVASVVVGVPTKEGLGADPTSPYYAGSNMLTHSTIAPDDNGQLKIVLMEGLW